jgi:hypothetical protein
MSHQQMTTSFSTILSTKPVSSSSTVLPVQNQYPTQNPILTSFPALILLNQKVFAKIFSIVDLPAPFFSNKTNTVSGYLIESKSLQINKNLQTIN